MKKPHGYVQVGGMVVRAVLCADHYVSAASACEWPADFKGADMNALTVRCVNVSRVCRSSAILACSLLLWYGPAAADTAPAKAQDAKVAPSLLKPGFVFMELATKRTEDYEAFFASVAGFQVTYRKPGYIQAQSEHAELTFIDPAHWGPGHPSHGKVTGSGMGVGIEIGIVVADIEKAHAAALAFKDKGWPISTGIIMRPWGLRDFRVLAPDGYYLRFTEGR